MKGHIALITCVVVVLSKFALITRININWDEFWFLSRIHEFTRGELENPFQSAYVQLFQWLPATGQEIVQIHLGRALMLGFLAMTGFLLRRLAEYWMDARVAWVAPLSYLTSTPVLLHGGAFRVDSLLAPLTVGTLLLLVRAVGTRRGVMLAGVCFGVALALTIKAVLLIPVAVLLIHMRVSEGRDPPHADLQATVRALAWWGAITLCVASLILISHAATLGDGTLLMAGESASSAASKTLLTTPWIPQSKYWLQTWNADRIFWILLLLGAIYAIARRQFGLLACGLSLLPILFYRNTYPYYYVVMLAPASVLVAIGVDALSKASQMLPGLLAKVPARTLVALLLAASAGVTLYELKDDRQDAQRQVVAAVHRIFPEPVAYIDHSGMMSSFYKSNFFMSTWGVDNYRAEGKSFMRDALDRDHAVLLLVNRAELNIRAQVFDRRLLEEDKALIRKFYVPYWGPVSIAGAQGVLNVADSLSLELPFGGNYRLHSAIPIAIDGQLFRDGDVLKVVGYRPRVNLAAINDFADPVHVSLVWAKAMPPPDTPPPAGPLYVGFGSLPGRLIR